MDLQPLTDSCHWSEIARRLVAADRRPLQVHVAYGNLLESRRQLSDHRTMFVLLVCDQCTILSVTNAKYLRPLTISGDYRMMVVHWSQTY